MKYLDDHVSYGCKTKKSSDICQRILTFLAMLVSAIDNDVFEQKACECFMRAFSTTGVEVSDLKVLYEEIHSLQRYYLTFASSINS